MMTSRMTVPELFDILRHSFQQIIDENGLAADDIRIRSKSLTVEEAIGITKRKDFPIITGKEVMLQADYKGSQGQAFTDSPAVFSGRFRRFCSWTSSGTSTPGGCSSPPSTP